MVYTNEQAKARKASILFNVGFDARHYLPVYRNLIWAVRAAGDFSFGDQKVVYYLGGVDNWFGPKFNDANMSNRKLYLPVISCQPAGDFRKMQPMEIMH